MLGGANFPDKYPWEGGVKTWWSTLYSYDLHMDKWTVYDDFLNSSLAYGVSICLPEGLLCIGGCDRMQCSDKVFLIKKEGVSFVVDSVSYRLYRFRWQMQRGLLGITVFILLGGRKL